MVFDLSDRHDIICCRHLFRIAQEQSHMPLPHRRITVFYIYVSLPDTYAGSNPDTDNTFLSSQTNVGSILISLNSYKELGNALTLNSTRTKETSEQLRRVVREAVRQQSETGYPQGIILSGERDAEKRALPVDVFYWVLDT